jgi:hypothetical protein
MHSATTTNRGIVGYSGAALIASLAMAITGVSGATAVGAAAIARPISLFSQAGNTHTCNKGYKWCAWSGSALGLRSHQIRATASARPNSVAKMMPASFNFANLTAVAPSSSSTTASTDVLGVLATDLPPVSTTSASLPPVEFAGIVTTSLETRTTWRSNAFSIAGSRIWSKVIKFSSTGVNVRVPLN